MTLSSARLLIDRFLTDKPMAVESGDASEAQPGLLLEATAAHTSWPRRRVENEAAWSFFHVCSLSLQLSRTWEGTRTTSPSRQVGERVYHGYEAWIFGILVSIEWSSRDPFVRTILIQTSGDILPLVQTPSPILVHSISCPPRPAPSDALGTIRRVHYSSRSCALTSSLGVV